MKKTRPQYYKTSDDLAKKMPDESDSGWPSEVVDGLNRALKSATAISEETYGASATSEIKVIDINIGSPWKLMPNFTGNYTGADSGTGGFTSNLRYMKHYDGSVEFQGSYLGAVAPGFPARWWLPHNLGTLQPQLRPPYTVIYPIFGYQNSALFATAPAYISITNLGVVNVFGSDLSGAVAAGSAPHQFNVNMRYMASDSRPEPTPGYPISFKVKTTSPPVGVIPIASVDLSQNTVRPGPMLASADWEFSREEDSGVVRIRNLSFSGFNNRIKVWFLVIYR